MTARFALVTDTTADIPAALAEERQIYMIPQVIVWGRETLQDRVDITSPAFYKRLATAKEMPTTSRPAPTDLADLWQRARDETDAESVVMLSVSAEVSGTISSCQEASKMVDFPVHVLDTRTISLALGLTVLRTADVRDGDAEPEAAVAFAKQLAENSHALFTPGTLEFLHRGGRIGGAQHLIGTALSIKPILHLVDGRVEALESIRTRKRALSRLLELVEEKRNPDKPLYIGVVHGNALDEAHQLAGEIEQRWLPAMLLQGWVSPSIGVHAGPGVIGVMLVQ